MVAALCAPRRRGECGGGLMPKITKARGATSKYDGSNRLAGGSTEAAPGGPSPARPPAKASKAIWVAYADSLGVDSSGSKKEIIGRIDFEGE
jgi:hypothetical protein